MIGKKRVWVYKDGVLYGKFESRIEAIYKCHVSYASIRKSIKTGCYIHGFVFKEPVIA